MSVTVLLSCLVLVVISASLINFSHMLNHVVSMIIKVLATSCLNYLVVKFRRSHFLSDV